MKRFVQMNQSIGLSCSLLMSIFFFLLFHVSAAFTDEFESGSGAVSKLFDVGSYTYIQLKESGKWLATSRLSVGVGDEIEYQGGMEMRGFYSKTLDRKFASIVFVQRVFPVSEVAEHIQRGAMVEAQHGVDGKGIQTSPSVDAPAPGEITPLPGGETIADVLATNSRLDGQRVNLRARVVKVSRNIMGLNWITLQDGTGATPDDKLIATSVEVVSPGQLVVVSGVIRSNVDIGSGYRYKVLLERAKFTVSGNSE